MLNLFEIATENATALDGRFSTLCSSASPETRSSLQKFIELVVNLGCVTINMRPMSLISFLALGTHQNIYEWARSRAEESSRPIEEIIRERLGPFYASRTTFDRFFVNGESFRYGALNVGGSGVCVYGDYCLVLQRQIFEDTYVAYLRSDSLKTYVESDGSVDETLIRNETSPHSHRHVFAGLKHSPELDSTIERDWPAMLCSSTGFIEAVFSGTLAPAGVEAVRLEAKQYRELFEFGFENFRVKLTAERRHVVETFVLIKRVLREKRIPFEVTTSA